MAAASLRSWTGFCAADVGAAFTLMSDAIFGAVLGAGGMDGTTTAGSANCSASLARTDERVERGEHGHNQQRGDKSEVQEYRSGDRPSRFASG
jgi:hypothetical protein